MNRGYMYQVLAFYQLDRVVLMQAGAPAGFLTLKIKRISKFYDTYLN